jgi:hypothetical protein
MHGNRCFCETLDHKILFRLALRFFDPVVCKARALELFADEHFSVDGTLIEAWGHSDPRTAGVRGPMPAGTEIFRASGAPHSSLLVWTKAFFTHG